MIIKNGKRMDGCSDTVPIGSIYPYLGTTPPFGYLILDGSMVSKSIYPELYSICGTIYGAETLETFKLPDLRGVTVAGYKENDLVFGTLGGLAGSLTHQHSTSEHTLTVDEIPSHNHRFDFSTSGTQALSGNHGAYMIAGYSDTAIQNTGGGQAHTHGDTGSASSVQPTITLNWIVKAIKMIPNMSSVQNSYQTSSTNTYSCNYINSVVGSSSNIVVLEGAVRISTGGTVSYPTGFTKDNTTILSFLWGGERDGAIFYGELASNPITLSLTTEGISITFSSSEAGNQYLEYKLTIMKYTPQS